VKKNEFKEPNIGDVFGNEMLYMRWRGEVSANIMFGLRCALCINIERCIVM